MKVTLSNKFQYENLESLIHAPTVVLFEESWTNVALGSSYSELTTWGSFASRSLRSTYTVEQ